MPITHRYRSRRFRDNQGASLLLAAALAYSAFASSAQAQNTDELRIKEFKGCLEEVCINRTGTIIKATDLWRATYTNLFGSSPPPELDAALSVSAAGIESHMGNAPTMNKGVHKYLFQFVPNLDDPTIKDIMPGFLKTLRAAQSQIDILINIPNLTPEIIISEKIFSDDVVQTHAFLEYARLNLPVIKKHRNAPHFGKTHIENLIYNGHNLPSMGVVVMDNFFCPLPVSMLKLSDAQYRIIHKLKPKKGSRDVAKKTLLHAKAWRKAYNNRARNFLSNPIVYDKGRFPPSYVLAQISAWQLPYLQIAKKHFPDHPRFSSRVFTPVKPFRVYTGDLVKGLRNYYLKRSTYCK